MDEISKSALFFKLYTGVSSRIYSYLLIMVHNKDSAEELAQETAMLLWTKFDEYEPGTNFGAWAISVARLKSLEYLRKRKQSLMVFDEQFYELVSDRAAKSSDELSNRIGALKACLEKLSDYQVKILSMRFKQNISVKKISQLTGRPVDSLYHLFSKLIKGLRVCVEKQLLLQKRS